MQLCILSAVNLWGAPAAETTFSSIIIEPISFAPPCKVSCAVSADLLPADIIGTQIYSPKKENFSIKKGPIFANFVLADEINRAPAKVQSALLEAMQERQVTIGGDSFDLDIPFLVMATQNPVEQEGTYPLPEAQVDRFMLKVVIDYPKKDEEKVIIRNNLAKTFPSPKSVLKTDAIIRARELVKEIYMDEKIEQYIIDIVFATRNPKEYGLDKFQNMISFGGSPRASINLAIASKAYAFIKRRSRKTYKRGYSRLFNNYWGSKRWWGSLQCYCDI